MGKFLPGFSALATVEIRGQATHAIQALELPELICQTTVSGHLIVGVFASGLLSLDFSFDGSEVVVPESLSQLDLVLTGIEG